MHQKFLTYNHSCNFRSSFRSPKSNACNDDQNHGRGPLTYLKERQEYMTRMPLCYFDSSTCTNGIKNGRVPSGGGGAEDEATPAKRSKTAENNAASSPVPREPFELAQLKSYGK